MCESAGRQPSSSRTMSVLTPQGRSAVAVVCVSAEPDVFDQPAPLFVAANGRPIAKQPINRLCYGRWGHDPGEDSVVCRIAPRVTEVACHGGAWAVARIVRDLQDRGCEMVDGLAAARAREPLVTAECRVALTRASTLRTAAILLEQAEGLLETAINETLRSPTTDWTTRISQWLEWADFGAHLTRPWQVSLIGVPNVGKSSLMNALLGYGRSIVYAEPGTTRDVVSAVTAFEGWPVELFDTAGLRDAAGDIEAEGVIRARRQAAEADLAVVVLDRSRAVRADERRLIAEIPRALVVANKSDLPNGWTEDVADNAIHVSSVTDDRVDELAARIARSLVPDIPVSGTAIPVSRRQTEQLKSAMAAANSGDLSVARECLLELCDGREVRSSDQTSQT